MHGVRSIEAASLVAGLAAGLALGSLVGVIYSVGPPGGGSDADRRPLAAPPVRSART